MLTYGKVIHRTWETTLDDIFISLECYFGPTFRLVVLGNNIELFSIYTCYPVGVNFTVFFAKPYICKFFHLWVVKKL